MSRPPSVVTSFPHPRGFGLCCQGLPPLKGLQPPDIWLDQSAQCFSPKMTTCQSLQCLSASACTSALPTFSAVRASGSGCVQGLL